MKEQSSKVESQELTITQEELQELQKLEAVKFEAEKLRRSIRQRILGGAKVEPGKLKVTVSGEQRISLTQQSIQKLLGRLGIEILKALPRQRIFKMFVTSSHSSKKQSEPKAVVDPSDVNDTPIPGEESELVEIVLDALTAIDGSKTSKPKEDNKLLTMVKLKIEMLEYASNSDAEFYEEAFAFEDHDLSELSEI